MDNLNVKIVLVDDHAMLRSGLAAVIKDFGYQVLFEADNGKIMLEKLDKNNLPDLILLDINMKEMDGYETALWLKKNYPLIKVLALSMYDDEAAIMKMLRNGARGYVLKDNEPRELKAALDAVIHKGYYYSELVTGKLIHSINKADEEAIDGNIAKLSEREIKFLKLACSELTYKEIAAQMHLSPRTIDGYRDALFEKLDIKTRTGLAIYAIKNKLVQI
jgi:two-component system, NarL family, invasion response regulator UvrY